MLDLSGSVKQVRKSLAEKRLMHLLERAHLISEIMSSYQKEKDSLSLEIHNLVKEITKDEGSKL